MLSKNTSGIFVNFGEGSEEKPGENLTLVKGVKTDMGKYWVTYQSDSAHPTKQLWFFNIHFQRKDGKEDFVLQPNAFINYKGNEGLMANPDSRHYLDHDVFTYITSLPDPTKQREDTANFRTEKLAVGDSVFYSNGFMILEDLRFRDNLPEEIFGKEGTLQEADLKVYSKTGSIYSVTTRLAFAKGELLPVPDTITSESLVVALQKVKADKTVELGVKESNAVMQYVTLKAYKFPYIKILWYGIVVTAIGILMSMFRRISLNRRSAQS